MDSTLISARGGARAWRCKLCGKERKSGVDKVRYHLLKIEKKEMVVCTRVTDEKVKELKALDAICQAKHKIQPKRKAIDPNDFAFASSTPTPSVGGSGDAAPQVSFRSAFSTPTSSPPLSTRRQRTLDASWDPKKKEDVDSAVARFFYHDHIAFNKAR